MAQAPGTIEGQQSAVASPLAILNYLDYADLKMRNLSGDPPKAIYDDGQYPVRVLSLWPVPITTRAVELWLWQPLDTKNVDEELNLPPGYARALSYNLAVELAAVFMKEVAPSVVKVATESYANIQRLNQLHLTQSMSTNYPLAGSPFNSRNPSNINKFSR